MTTGTTETVFIKGGTLAFVTDVSGSFFSRQSAVNLLNYLTSVTRVRKAIDWQPFARGNMYVHNNLSESEKRFILERDSYVCAYCNGIADAVDHVVPWAFSQNDNPANLVACCSDCNQIALDNVFDSFYDKREYILKIRNLPRWKRKIAKNISLCTECKHPYRGGSNGSTRFLCRDCNKENLEWSGKATI